MRAFFWIITILAAVVAGFVLITGEVDASGAPQEAAAAAIAVAIVLIPYCLARAVTELAELTKRQSPASIASPNVDVRCNQCSRIYSGRERECPACGAHRMDSVPV